MVDSSSSPSHGRDPHSPQPSSLTWTASQPPQRPASRPSLDLGARLRVVCPSPLPKVFGTAGSRVGVLLIPVGGLASFRHSIVARDRIFGIRQVLLFPLQEFLYCFPLQVILDSIDPFYYVRSYHIVFIVSRTLYLYPVVIIVKLLPHPI